MEAHAGQGAEGNVVTGILHVYVAFDWGDAMDLEHASRLAPAEVHVLPRRRRTPVTIAYRPPPLRFNLPRAQVDLPEIGPLAGPAEVTVFDFAAVSVALHFPFTLSAASVTRLAGDLADPAPLEQKARSLLEPLYRLLLPAIQDPMWSKLSEEYFVFQMPPSDMLPPPSIFLNSQAGWLAGLVRLEAGPLSSEEITEALRLHLSYSPGDLVVPDWAAAVLLDRDCEETLQTMEFANLQLLEFRHIDDRLDDRLAAAYHLIHPPAPTWRPFWRTHGLSIRALGELKVEAYGLFERTGNVLKLVGDQYLARVYDLLAARFHLQEWEESIRRKLEVAEGIYQTLSDQAATYRTEFLEVVVIILIILEIVLPLFHH